MLKKEIMYSIIIAFTVILIVAMIIPSLYPILFIYMVVSLIYLGIMVRDVENFGKVAIAMMIGSVLLYLFTFNIEFSGAFMVVKDIISDAGMFFFFIYLMIILPKYSSRLHMGMEDSGVGTYHIHEGFIGIVLYVIMSFVLFIPTIISYLTPWNISIAHSICLILGGGGNILATFFIARDWDDVLHGLFIEKVKEGEQPEEHESFWIPPKQLLKKYTKLNDFTSGFIFCGAAIAFYYSPLFIYDILKLPLTFITLILLTFGGFLIGRDWILMLKDRFGETINRPLLLALKDSLTPDQKIVSVDSITYPIWIISGTIEKKKRRFLFFKKKVKIEKTLLIDDITGKFLYIQESNLERIPEFLEDIDEVEMYDGGYLEIDRRLSNETIIKKISFLDEIEIRPGILPLYAIKLKNNTKGNEEFLGVHINNGHKLKLYQDYSINYLMPYKEEREKVKNIISRISKFFKSFYKKKTSN
jgi:hypothetical protein